VRTEGRHFSVDGELATVNVDYRVPGTAVTLALASEGPAHLHGSHRALALEPLRLRGMGIDAVAEGRLTTELVDGHLHAQLDIGRLAGPLGPLVKESAGVVALDMLAEGSSHAPALSGRVTVREPVRVWPVGLIVPVQVTGGAVSFAGPALRIERLSLSVASSTLNLDGGARLSRDVAGTTLDLQVAGAVEGASLARRLPELLTEGRGRIWANGHLGGTAASPTFDGHLDFAGFGARVAKVPFELRAVDGRVEAHGHTLTTSSLTLVLGPAGRLQIGAPDAPATFEVVSLQPPDLGGLAVRVRGKDLATSVPLSGLRFQDLDLELRLDHSLHGPLRVAGDVWIEGATLSPKEIRPAGPATAPIKASVRVARELFPEIFLDVGVHSPHGALTIEVPYLPDVDVTLDCRVTGSYRRPHVAGRAHGDGVYSRLAIFLYDVFSDKHVRRCGAK
jgi:hypothetical protein